MVGLCVSVIKIKNNDFHQHSEAQKSIMHALYGLCNYTAVSQILCHVSFLIYQITTETSVS